MTDVVRFDRDALRDFTDRMELIAGDLEEVYAHASRVCSGDDAGHPGKRRHGVRVALGTLGEDHGAADTGELLALRVSESLTLASGLAASVRELGTLVDEVRHSLDAADTVTATELGRIVEDLTGVSVEGVESGGRLDGLRASDP
ncbi:hypothetical protein LX16_2995 [Stackebrandtia albiflava]|uniref:Uncharacterized protein n=1 Tax=Stackebrandtia albiflava TaxID=406432 RepID=A0A562V2W0_9ACTN|nr:hypothetical protein [Stackebrandtia albiflava]TWJ12240.1 hypothetical protein LX16_2995 [Stackebrandtia albiflava]